MAESGEGPPPSWDGSPPPDDDGWWDVLAASPLGDIALGAAICAVGAILIFAVRRIPMFVLAAGVGSVVVAVFVVARHVARSGRAWAPSQYLLFAAMTAGSLAVGLGIVYLAWVMLCDC